MYMYMGPRDVATGTSESELEVGHAALRGLASRVVRMFGANKVYLVGLERGGKVSAGHGVDAG
jgi:hypothetical protein